MQQYNMVFKRYEQKYLLSREQYAELWKRVSTHLVADEYGHSTICNLYYDTDNYDLIRHSIEHPVYKEKLRLRSYGVPDSDTVVFLEIKKKYNRIVYKRRISLTLDDARTGLEQGCIEPARGQEQVTAEINYFLKRYPLRPAVFLAYDRDAFYGADNRELRMTFDTNLRSRKNRLLLSAGDDGDALFADGEVLLEVKASGAYPFWLIRIMEECEIYPASFSKYGSIYKRSLLPDYLNRLSLHQTVPVSGGIGKEEYTFV